MNPIHKALIEAIVHLATTEGSDGCEDDDIRAIEVIISEIRNANPEEQNKFISAINAELSESQDPGRIDALESLVEALTD